MIFTVILVSMCNVTFKQWKWRNMVWKIPKLSSSTTHISIWDTWKYEIDMYQVDCILKVLFMIFKNWKTLGWQFTPARTILEIYLLAKLPEICQPFSKSPRLIMNTDISYVLCKFQVDSCNIFCQHHKLPNIDISICL